MMYHGRSFELIQYHPKILHYNQELLNDFENKYSIKIPKSIKEFYQLDGYQNILEKYSNCDHPVKISEFKLTNIKEAKLAIEVLVENQGVCNWGVIIDDDEDPQVYVNVDNAGWKLHSNTFSNFIFSRLWDYSFEEKYCVDIQSTSPISKELLNQIENKYEKLPTTNYWPGEKQLRFRFKETELTLWMDSFQTDWLLKSRNKSQFTNEIEKINLFLKDEDKISKDEIRLERKI